MVRLGLFLRGTRRPYIRLVKKHSKQKWVKPKTKTYSKQKQRSDPLEINSSNIPHLPSVRIATDSQKRLMNRVWYSVFSNDQTFNLIAADQTIRPKPGNGLVYCYSVRGVIRYVGQTKKSLKSRMLTKFDNGRFGYNYTIKRLIIDAYKNSCLQIATNQVLLSELDEHEKYCIDFFGKSNSLWNIADNNYYRGQNRYIS